jgi:hypothetical protein
MEEQERVESEGLAKAVLVEKHSPPATIGIEQSSAGQMAIDVYGQQIEPICNYRTCHHKFSTHGRSTQCKCRHALNYALGLSLKTDCMTYD